MLQSPVPMVLLWGPDGVMLYNDAYSGFAGARHPRLLGSKVLEGWPEVADFNAHVMHVGLGGGTLSYRDLQLTLPRHGALEDVWMNLDYSPVLDEDGRPAGVLAVVVETSARVLAERALTVERARPEEVFRRSPSFAVAYRGPEHRYEFVNAAYYGLIGHRPVLGRPLDEAIPEAREQGFTGLLDGVLTTGEPWVGRETPVWLERTPGAPRELRYVDMVFQALTEADGARGERVTGVLAHGVDITDHVLARREVERLLAESERARAEAEQARAEAELAREAAEAGARAKAEFLATMSHEIRTPINAITGYTQLLELGIPDPVTPAQREQLGRVTASARHLLGLVDDVLDVAKMDAGELRVAREAATTGLGVSAALALVRPQADQRGVRLVDTREGQAGVAYVGDDARVRQILVNLLSNAVKFTPAGGTVTVTCGTATDADPGARVEGAGPWAYLAVADTGIGIAPEQQAAVFEPFVQAEVRGALRGQSPYTRTAGGTGLGLTISRRLARLMGGDLVLESAPGAGATFTLWLPATAVSPAGEAEAAHVRTARAGLGGAGWRVHGLAEVGHALRAEVDAILEAHTATLRADPDVPSARAMGRARLEDHAVTLLADLAQSLVIIADADDEAAALMGDGTAIQRTVAELHGARRFVQGWSQAAVRREHAVLQEVVARVVRGRVAPPNGGTPAGDVSEALAVLARLHARVEALSLAAYYHAAATAGDAAAARDAG